jgi:hypothetical protein
LGRARAQHELHDVATARALWHLGIAAELRQVRAPGVDPCHRRWGPRGRRGRRDQVMDSRGHFDGEQLLHRFGGAVLGVTIADAGADWLDRSVGSHRRRGRSGLRIRCPKRSVGMLQFGLTGSEEAYSPAIFGAMRAKIAVAATRTSGATRRRSLGINSSPRRAKRSTRGASCVVVSHRSRDVSRRSLVGRASTIPVSVAWRRVRRSREASPVGRSSTIRRLVPHHPFGFPPRGDGAADEPS